MKNETHIFVLALAMAALTLGAPAQDFSFATNNGALTITKFNGAGGDVIVPGQVDGLLVTAVGDSAFAGRTDVTRVVMPDSVTGIGSFAFSGCKGLKSVAIPKSLQTLGERAFNRCANLSNVDLPATLAAIPDGAFLDCVSLTNLFLPTGVTSIGGAAFQRCVGLKEVSLPPSLASIGNAAFSQCSGLQSILIPAAMVNLGDGVFNYCDHLTAAYFMGNALEAKPDMPFFYSPTTIYYLPGTVGWETTFRGRPTERWFLPGPVILSQASGFGMQAGQFGFRISWATNALMVIEAADNPESPTWIPVQTNALADGWTDYYDPDFKNHPVRFYRVRPF